MSIFTHRGPWDEHSRQYPILRFLEKYQSVIDSRDLTSTPWSAFYSYDAVFHDTRGDVWISGSHIWKRFQTLYSPFKRLLHEVTEVRAILEEDGRYVIYAEYLTHFWLRGDEEAVAPIFFVFIVGDTKDHEGTDGFQILEGSVFWDTGILARHFEER